MGIINRVILVRAGGDAPERLRIKEFPASESGMKHVATAAAAVYAATAYAGLRRHIPRPVGRLK
jgi:hypothetical protein